MSKTTCRDGRHDASRLAEYQVTERQGACGSMVNYASGEPTDGEKTLRENMADYGGLTLAYELYKNKCKRQGFKGDDLDRQLRKFMVAYAYYWRYYYSEADLETWYRIDNHAVCPNRINGTLRLLDDWYRLYDVQPGDKLYLAPEKRVKIW